MATHCINMISYLCDKVAPSHSGPFLPCQNRSLKLPKVALIFGLLWSVLDGLKRVYHFFKSQISQTFVSFVRITFYVEWLGESI